MLRSLARATPGVSQTSSPPLPLVTVVVAVAVVTLFCLVGCGADGGVLSDAEVLRPGARVTSRYRLYAEELGRVDGAVVRAGGYSGLAFDSAGSLWAITDRGPNLEAATARLHAAKRFPLPDYRPHARRIDSAGGQLALGERLGFLAADGGAATGLPPPSAAPGLVVEEALGPDFETLPHDPDGIDSEGVAFGAGSLWVSDEYRPSVWRLDPGSGRLLARYTPTPTGPLDRRLPAWLLQRRPNLGFEGLAFQRDPGYLYVALQGPLSPPGADARTRLVRILRLDPATDRVRSFVYPLDGSRRKIGDLALSPEGYLLVLEHGERFGRPWSAEVYAVDLARVDYLNDDGLPPERFSDVPTALTAGVLVAGKELYVDLLAAGWPAAWSKPEGLACDAAGRLYLVNDDDFGIDSPAGTGAAVMTGADSYLVVIE